LAKIFDIQTACNPLLHYPRPMRQPIIICNLSGVHHTKFLTKLELRLVLFQVLSRIYCIAMICV
jgi:hypothetical protein